MLKLMVERESKIEGEHKKAMEELLQQHRAKTERYQEL
jgi:hypothetical protein